MVKVFDYKGEEKDWGWLVGRFGPLEHLAADDGPAFRLVALRERADPPTEAPSSLVVKVLDADGQPMDGADVAWYWPDAPTDANAGPLGGVLSHMRPNRCVHGPTNINGDVGFGMGHGAYYWPDKGEIGPHAVWVYGANVPSDLILGLGMVAATNHTHLDVDIQWIEEEEPPSDGVKYFDVDGKEKDEAWALTYFGPPNIHEPVSDNAYRLIELQADNDPAHIHKVMVVDEDGEPLPGVLVLMGTRDIDPRVVLEATTGADGVAEFELTNAHLYNAPEEAHHRVAVAEWDSDVCSIGLVKANPRRWLNMVYMLKSGTPPDPSPIRGWIEEIRILLDNIEGATALQGGKNAL